MEIKEFKVNIDRKPSDQSENLVSVCLVFSEFETVSIDLCDGGTDDLSDFFNIIFQYVISEEEIPRFVLDDNNRDLFHDVTKDIISQLNDEIENSKDNFRKIIELAAEKL